MGTSLSRSFVDAFQGHFPSNKPQTRIVYRRAWEIPTLGFLHFIPLCRALDLAFSFQRERERELLFKRETEHQQWVMGHVGATVVCLRGLLQHKSIECRLQSAHSSSSGPVAAGCARALSATPLAVHSACGVSVDEQKALFIYKHLIPFIHDGRAVERRRIPSLTRNIADAVTNSHRRSRHRRRPLEHAAVTAGNRRACPAGPGRSWANSSAQSPRGSTR